jgi:tetratricopeptide (TPR) repeat protein
MRAVMPSRPALPVLVASLCLCAAPMRVRAADATATELATQARAECEAGRRAQDRGERQAHFEKGQQIAQQAVAADDNSAEAHFALFCNMGELMRLDGETITSLFQLHRLMAELDRALELKPDYTDALSSKGQLLVRLPRMLGGDPVKGEALLRQVIASDPNAFNSRLVLAKVCDGRGDRREAIDFATRAFQIAKEQGRADKIAEARATLDELHAAR